VDTRHADWTVIDTPKEEEAVALLATWDEIRKMQPVTIANNMDFKWTVPPNSRNSSNELSAIFLEIFNERSRGSHVRLA
jgi:hypothetical protein